MNSKQLHLTGCPAVLKGDDQPEDIPLKLQNSNLPPPPSKIVKKQFQSGASEPLYERLNQEAEIFKQNNQLLKDYYEQEELRPCSFNPQILNDGQEKRSLYQFLVDQQNHVLRVEQKLEQRKQDDIERDLSHPYHPKTNDFNFNNRDDTVPTYERLYGLRKKQDIAPPELFAKEEEKSEHRPQIQEKSKNLVRNQKVEDILYQDAMRRNQKQKEAAKKKDTKVVTLNMKFTSNNSERIVAQKFIREFETVIDWIFDQTGQERPSNVSFSIDYLKLGEALQRLCFLNQLQVKQDVNEKAVEYENLRLSEERALLCEIWSILRGDELGGISKRNLCLFLLTLIGITDFKIKELPANDVYPDYMKSIQPQQHKIVTAHQPNDKPKLGKIDKDGNIIFSFEETKRLQKQFDILYRNRLGSEELKKTNWKDENPYKPTILPASKALASQYREKMLEETAQLIDNQLIKVSIPENGQITHADMLVLQKKTLDYQKELKKQEVLQKQMEKCSFKPHLTAQQVGSEERKSVQQKSQKYLQLYSLAKPQTQKRDRTTEEIEFEKQQEECTFQPDRQGVRGQVQVQGAKSFVNKDVDKSILRMKQARQRREEVQAMLERGYQSTNTVVVQPSVKQSTKVSRSQSQNQLKSSSSYRQKSQQSQDSQYVNTYQTQNYHVDEVSQQKEESRSGSCKESCKRLEQEERIPLLFVDVNLGPSKTERIVVYEGDQSSDLAARFALEHNLDEFMQEKLKELLDYQISGLLTKIDEEEGATSDNDG